ncbi:MAG: carboxylating nicotinate-nucleotide diphosphorylase [Candidatus Eutrophobiaceae bacterium]
MSVEPPSLEEIARTVRVALDEDLGSGDVSVSLIPQGRYSQAHLVCRERAILCGRPWFECCFQELDANARFEWTADEGQCVASGQIICRLEGATRALLSAERSALNFLQTLSGTATTVAEYISALPPDTSLQILDTRKTLPGLRQAQKYAVLCGGGTNHRMGLYDSWLIKENHLAAGIDLNAAINSARQSGLPFQVEVKNLAELQHALDAGVDLILLDNFSETDLQASVELNQGRAQLEASGNLQASHLPRLATLGVHRTSIGALTKHLRAIDFSLLLDK